MRIRFLAVLFFLAVACVGPAFGLSLAPIPDGFNIVIVLHNHSGLPIADFTDKIPFPPPVKEKIDEFLSGTGFHPLRDITRIQIMAKKTRPGKGKPDEGLVVITCKFPKAKIAEFIKSKGIPLQESKLGSFDFWSGPKGGICFLSDSKIAVGPESTLQKFIEALEGKNLSKDFDSIGNSINDKAYFTLLVGNKEYLKAEIKRQGERREQRAGEQKPLAKFFNAYLTEGTEPILLQVHVLDSQAEFKGTYTRDGKAFSFRALAECDDPKLALNNLLPAFAEEALKNLPPRVGMGKLGNRPRKNKE